MIQLEASEVSFAQVSFISCLLGSVLGLEKLTRKCTPACQIQTFASESSDHERESMRAIRTDRMQFRDYSGPVGSK